VLLQQQVAVLLQQQVAVLHSCEGSVSDQKRVDGARQHGSPMNSVVSRPALWTSTGVDYIDHVVLLLCCC
jgi:hypothetical protein